MRFSLKLLIYSTILLGSLACGQKNDLYLPPLEQGEIQQQGDAGDASE